MTKMWLQSSLMAMLVMASSAAMAQNATEDKKTPGSGPNPFRDCGVGAALFPNTGWAAVTSNIIWDIGLTALTSATSSPQTCNGKTTEVAQFIADTYAAVIDETARGDGEHLAAMLEIYGCAADSHEQIVGVVRADMGPQVAAPTYASMTINEKSEQYFLILDQHVREGFAAHCAV